VRHSVKYSHAFIASLELLTLVNSPIDIGGAPRHALCRARSIAWRAIRTRATYIGAAISVVIAKVQRVCARRRVNTRRRTRDTLGVAIVLARGDKRATRARAIAQRVINKCLADAARRAVARVVGVETRGDARTTRNVRGRRAHDQRRQESQ